MSIFVIVIVSFLSGFIASLGLGGGMVLIIYLAIFTGMGQLEAQGINLIFFIPIALISIILHTKSKLIIWKRIIPSIITGVIAALVFSFIASMLGSKVLSKIFSVFIIIIGIRELIKKSDKQKNAEQN